MIDPCRYFQCFFPSMQFDIYFRAGSKHDNRKRSKGRYIPHLCMLIAAFSYC